MERGEFWMRGFQSMVKSAIEKYDATYEFLLMAEKKTASEFIKDSPEFSRYARGKSSIESLREEMLNKRNSINGLLTLSGFRSVMAATSTNNNLSSLLFIEAENAGIVRYLVSNIVESDDIRYAVILNDWASRVLFYIDVGMLGDQQVAAGLNKIRIRCEKVALDETCKEILQPMSAKQKSGRVL